MIGRLWAIAKVTIAQGVRMKIFVVVVIFLIAALLGLPHVLQTDGTQLGQARIVMSYTMYLAMFLLSILTLFLAVASVGQEIEQRQIFLLDPKPVRRWHIFAGKWLGIMILNVGLLLIMGGASYIGLRYITRPVEGAEEEYADFRQRFMVAKDKVLPDLPYDIDRKIEEEYQKWVADGRIDPDRSKRWVTRRMTPIVARQLNAVRPNRIKAWEFSGLPVDLPPGMELQFRFRHYVTHRRTADDLGRMTVKGIWLFGDPEVAWFLREYDATPDDFHEFDIPAGVISDDGSLRVEYYNALAASPTVIFPFEDGLELYYPMGAMEPNLARALAIFLIMMGFLAILGLACGANLSFPVAVLLAMSVFMVGLSWDFLSGLSETAYLFGPDERQPAAALNPGDRALQTIIRGALQLFPPLLRHSPVALLSNAEMITWRMIWRALLELILIRGGLVAALGAYIFHRRELGATEGQ